MIRRWTILMLFCVTVGFLPASVEAQNEDEIHVLNLRGPLTSAMVDYLDRGFAQAKGADSRAVILQLDTPGGSVALMNTMVETILASEIPVIVYVAPRGAMAASAGTLITLAGHAAAMAPETAIGAASPVGGQGEDLGETIAAKEKEILRATVRGLAADRGEDALALAEATIEDARAASVDEAYQIGLIDYIAIDLEDLILQLDGAEFVMNDGRVIQLQTADVALVMVELSFIERVLQTATNPNIIFLLLAAGIQAILIEISNPGGWVAGFIGVVFLSLGAYGLGFLPVNWFGLIFLLTSFVLFFLEIKAPTHGALTAAGLVSFVVGALVLFNTPGTPEFQRVSIPLVLVTAFITAALFGAVVTFAIRAQRRKIEVGKEALIQQVGRAQTDLNPGGLVQIGGELWTAELVAGQSEIKANQLVEVVKVEGLRLQVKRMDSHTG
jgi:membrane-bound serine protease (ClpP class)